MCPLKDDPPAPERAPKPSARNRREVKVEEEPLENSHKEEPQEEVKEEPQEEVKEPQEEVKEPLEEVKEIENNVEEEVDNAPVQADPPADEDSFEARQAERRRRREQRQKDLQQLSSAEKSIPNGTEKPKSEESTAKDAREKSPLEEDSYEARREARRRAREERLKAAAAKVEEKQEPRLSYRERKARESMQNAKDSRKKWENREDESGEK